MIKRLVVVMMSVALSAASGQAAINSTGDVTPPDPATWTSSTIAYIGNTGVGSVTVDADSDLLSGYGYLGYQAGADGTVTIAGAGSTWTTSHDIMVAREGSGTMNITAGGAISSRGSHIGTRPGGAGLVTVDGVGSTWTNTSSLVIGSYSSGTLNITGGGAVSNVWGGIGTSGGSGVVTVDGAGSTWTNSDDLYVGYYMDYEGSGTVNIAGGGAVIVQQDTWVACSVGSSGTIHFDSGTLTTGGLLCGADDLTGIGTINTNGIVSDVDVVFDSTHGQSPTFVIDDNPGQSITVNLSPDGSRAMGVGFRGNGTMSISDGIVVESTKGYIGYLAGSTGEVTVDGAGSTWATADDLDVGRDGSGTLHITDGGAVTAVGNLVIGCNSSSTGHATVAGIGSTLTGGYLVVGDNGNGTLNIAAGGTVVSETARIGSGVSGVVTVNGPGSTWTGDQLAVGEYGSGTLNITGGGTVNMGRNSYIANSWYSTGEATVAGPGSTWTNNGALYVGNVGDGALHVTDGGVVSSAAGGIGGHSGSTGVVTVEGAGSTWTNSGSLFVGNDGSGTLNITGGGLVSVGGILTIDDNGDGNGFINLATGGVLALGGDADDSLADFLGLIDGTDAIRYWNDDISDWDDITNAQVNVDYGLTYVAVGDLADHTMLKMYSFGDFDFDNDVDTRDIDLLGDAIRLGLTETTYDLSGAGEDGTPDGVIDINDLDYLVHRLVETSAGVGTEYGDFNLDGRVNNTDLTRLAVWYGMRDNWAYGNANRNVDLTTDVTDLTILSTYYNFGVPDTVPEPATLSLLAIGAVGLLRRRRGRGA